MKTTLWLIFLSHPFFILLASSLHCGGQWIFHARERFGGWWRLLCNWYLYHLHFLFCSLHLFALAGSKFFMQENSSEAGEEYFVIDIFITSILVLLASSVRSGGQWIQHHIRVLFQWRLLCSLRLVVKAVRTRHPLAKRCAKLCEALGLAKAGRRGNVGQRINQLLQDDAADTTSNTYKYIG